MRKLIILLFITLGIIAGVIAIDPAVPLVHLASTTPGEMPQGLLEGLLYALNTEESQEFTVSLSHEEYFYNETISVAITSDNPDAAIYYTTDGSDPTVESEEYAQPLIFTSEKDVNCYVLKAIAVDESGLSSSVLTQSYFVGNTVDERFQTPYIFSLSTDNDNLYGYENGILVPGKIYDDFMSENPDTQVEQVYRPANYNERGREWERPVYVEAFTSDGNRVIAQNAGVRISGNSTRVVIPQKSLRLVSRREYTPESGRFEYNFFDDFSSAEKFDKPILSYDTLILRNFGNDWGDGWIRTPLATQIAYEAGYDAVSPQVRAVVYINGEYYGYSSLNVRLNEKFLADLYNIQEENITILPGSGNHTVYTDDATIQAEFAQLLEYSRQSYKDNGTLDDTAKQAIEAFFDVDNLLFYYAINTYAANSDWPRKPDNITIWRYTGSPESVSHCEQADGRWRFTLHDLDMTMYSKDRSAYYAKSISDLLDGNTSPIFRAILLHPEYAAKFANYICDFAYEHFSVKNTSRILNQMDNEGLHDIKESLIRWDRDFSTFTNNRVRLYEFIEKRPEFILAELQEIFGYTDSYKIISDGSCKINTRGGNEGTYFVECSVPVTPIIERGQAFDHWLVNGEVRYEEELIVSFANADENGVVNVKCITRENLPPLFFGETYDTGDLYGFTMYNPNDTTQNTRGLYLSDDIYDLKKWAFPDMNIRPGSTWEFVGRNCTSVNALLKIGLSFNPRHGEVIFLSNEQGDILDYIMMEE